MALWHRRPALHACTALTLLALSGAAFAQDGKPSDQTVLQPIVVKSARSAAAARAGTAADTPLATTVSRD